jgi:putative inorganic carbon (hco3(-)) transporter
MPVLTNTIDHGVYRSDAGRGGRGRPGRAFEFHGAVASSHDFDADPPRYGVGFALFLLVNLVLFVRPAELIDGLEDVPIYEVAICACLLASVAVVVRQLTLRSLAASPATVFLLGFFAAIVAASLVHRDLWIARIEGLSFMKLVVYYLLAIGLVNSLSRLRAFTLFLFVAVLITAILVLLEYFGTINIRSMIPLQEGFDGGDGIDQVVGRVRGLGIFNDPNDLSLILMVATIIGLHFLTASRDWIRRIVWAIPICLILGVFQLTRSRGGFLALTAAICTMLVSRLGWKRGLISILICCPLVIPLMDARQSDIDLGDTNDTAQGRMQIWRDAMICFHREPILGLGATHLAEEAGHVAHNSYVQAFAETGFIGGTMFLGAIGLPIMMLRQVRRRAPLAAGDELLRWNSTLLAICVGYAVGMFSLTRNYTIPAYLPSAIAVAYCAIITARYPAAISYRMNWPLLRYVIAASVGCVVLLEVWCRFFIRG